MASPTTARVTFPTSAWVAIAVVFGAMLVLLTIQLTSIESQRRLVRDQDRKISALTREALPLLRATRPLVTTAAAAVPSVTRALDAARPVETLGAVRDLTTSLSEQDRLLRLIDAGLGALTQVGDRNLLGRADEALRQVPVALDRLRRTVVLQRDLLRVQRSTFALQGQSLAVLRDSLAVQRESLVHIRSLDRKTGGTASVP
jgi:hypothetical protein